MNNAKNAAQWQLRYFIAIDLKMEDEFKGYENTTLLYENSKLFIINNDIILLKESEWLLPKYIIPKLAKNKKYKIR